MRKAGLSWELQVSRITLDAGRDDVVWERTIAEPAYTRHVTEVLKEQGSEMKIPSRAWCEMRLERR